ncbi:MAG: autotransporter-associated beta strand repeat-containing protein [Luteolibacter sp.]|uniref:beta strand repeat-containing protein n=1 Tax=Luteolibacter sp. TaxID=1962973 RepID=UPI003266C366
MKTNLRNSFISPLFSYGIVAAAAFVLVYTGEAATLSWRTAADGNWSDSANWSSIVPLITDTAQFNLAAINGNETIYLNGNQGSAGLIFANTGTTTLLGGASGSPVANVLALTGTIVVNAGAGAVTIGDVAAKVDLTTNSSREYTNNSSNLLTFANGITSSGVSGTQTLTFGNTLGVGLGGVTVGGAIGNGGTGGIIILEVKAPRTTTTLLGTNVYTGNTALTQGKLTFGSSSIPSIIQGLGTISAAAGSDATVTSVRGNVGNSSLTFTTQTYTAGGALNYVVSGGTNGTDNMINTAGGAGFVNKQAFFNGADYAYRNGANTYMRAPVYGTDATFSIAGASLIGSAHNSIAASITGQGNAAVNTLKFSGAGAVDLTQTAATTLTFNTNSGILRSGGGSTTISGGTITTASGVAYVVRADTSSDSLTINSKFANVGTNTFTKSGEGTVTLGGTNTYTGTTFGNGGNLIITGTTATSVYQANGSGVINISGTNSATGATAVTAQNSGTVNINAPQNFTGATTVATNGTLGLGDDNALAGSSVTFQSGNIQAVGGARSTAATINFANANNYTINGSNDLTFNGPLNWLGTQTLTVSNAGTTTFAGTFTLRGITDTTAQRTLTLLGTGSTRFTGPVVNGGSLNGIIDFNGTGTVELNNNNSYSGLTTIRSGQTVKLGNTNGLGFGGATSVAGGTTVMSGGTLDLNGMTGIEEVITVNGSGVGGNGALINSNTGVTATIGSGVSQLAVGSVGSGYSSPPAVTINGGGGATANALLGISVDTIGLSANGSTYTTSPTITITGGGGTGAAATVDKTTGVVSISSTGFGYTSTPTVTLGAGAGLTGPGFSVSPAGDKFVVSALQMTAAGSGASLLPTVSFASGAATATANAVSVNLGGTGSIGGAGDLIVDAPVTGSLTKVGAGKLTLTGTSTYAGITTIDGGSLRIGNGGTTGRLTATSTINNNSNLTINRSDAFSQSGDLGSFAGIYGTGSFTQAGSGTTVLTAGNAYDGVTTVSAGTLIINGDQSGATGATQVATGATLGGSGVIGGDTTIDAGGALTFNLITDADSHFKLDVLGALNLGSSSSLKITGNSSAAVGVYTLISGSSLTGILPSIASLPSGWVANVQLSGDGNSVELNVTSVPALSPYQTWALGPFANPFTDTAGVSDPDGDGTKNLLEFVLGGDPTINDTPPIVPSVASASGTDLVITFKRSDVSELPPAVAVKLQVSDNLGSWPAGNDIAIGPVSDTGPIGATGASYTVDETSALDIIVVTIPKAAGAKKFARVIAVQP